MKKVLSFLTVLAVSISLFSQSEFKIKNQQYLSDQYSIPNYIEFIEGNAPSVNQLQTFLNKYWEGKSDFDLRLKSTFEDQLGDIHYKYVQTFKGVDIEFAEFVAHTKSNIIYSLSGKLISEYPSTEFEIGSESSALQSALNIINANSYKWEIAEEEQLLKVLEKDQAATYFPKGELSFMSEDLGLNPKKLRLCYKFNIYAHDPMGRAEYYVDANNNEIVFSNDLIHTANVVGSATTAYSGVRNINTDSISPNQYVLQQTVFGNGINTYNLQRGTSYGAAVDFTDTDNNWNNVNAFLDQYATDAHWGAEMTYDYFFTKFNRNSINNAGFALNSYIHYANNFVNAFWDGQRMTYGDGNGGITPLVALDVAGHEIAHGLTTFTADLIYARESGALNESFSDIFGAAVEQHARPNNSNWTIGEDMNFIIRSMSNPNANQDPDTYGGTFWLNQVGCIPSNQNDNCGVHINSGVQNFWFYLLSEGGSGTNDINDFFSIPRIGIDTAAAVAYRNLTVYLGRNSDFNEARFYSIQSAVDLYGACSPAMIAVTDAWHAVGVGAKFVPGVSANFISSDSISCNTPFTVAFRNESTNSFQFTWDFGDGTTSNLSDPIHTYTTSGQYDVSLLSDGFACGIDSISRIRYVDIDSTNDCVVILEDRANPTETDCDGKLYDSGVGFLEYDNNENGTITIAPTGASSVMLTFLNFDVEAGNSGTLCDHDYLEIYDGASISAPVIGKYCNNNLPPNTINSTRGSITLRFFSDGAIVNEGFEIKWDCNFPTAAPTANFSASLDTTCTGDVSFRDLSSNGATSWTWNFGDGNTSSMQDPTHVYALNGDYNVSLISANSFGADTLQINNVVHVNRPTMPVVVNDTTCYTQNALLSASGSGTLRWYESEFGGNPVNTGTSLQLSQPDYDTTLWVESFVRAPTQNFAPLSNTFGTGRFFNGNQYMIFDVFSDLILTDVFVYAGNSGNRTIELRDNTGAVLQSKTVFVSQGIFNVDLDFFIPAGSDYRLGVNGASANLYRNNSGVSYPYSLPGLISLKNSSAGTGFYYFFYYWRVKEFDCVSPRVPLTAVKDTTCSLTSINENTLLDEVKLYPNPIKEEFNLFIPSHADRIEIDLYDINGRVIKTMFESNSSSTSVLKQFNVEGIDSGIYFVTIKSNNTQITKRVVIL